MKKLSKIDESTWGEMRKRSSGKVIRNEDGKIVHTCLGVDIVIKNQDCDYNKFIKELINHSMDTDYGVTIVNTKEMSFSWEELANARKFEAPYMYMIYDGGHGTDLLASFWTYDEIQDFELDTDFAERISEDDYISICKGIATKLKEVGGELSHIPRRYETLGSSKTDKNYMGEYALQLIKESDVSWWAYNFSDEDGTSLLDFKEEMIDEFPELKYVDFITWTFYDGANIGLPLNYDTLMNFPKYKEFTKNWFRVDKVDESAWGDMRKRSSGESMRREDLPEQDKEHWWRNIELPNPPKWKKEELRGLDLAYNIVDKIRTTFNVKWPEQIIVHFNGEPYWDLTIEHITPYGSDSYSMYAHGNSSPWQVYFSKMTLNEKRSIRYRLENKKFYVYPLKYSGGTDYHLREDSNYKGEKGIELK